MKRLRVFIEGNGEDTVVIKILRAIARNRKSFHVVSTDQLVTGGREADIAITDDQVKALTMMERTENTKILVLHGIGSRNGEEIEALNAGRIQHANYTNLFSKLPELIKLIEGRKEILLLVGRKHRCDARKQLEALGRVTAVESSTEALITASNPVFDVALLAAEELTAENNAQWYGQDWIGKGFTLFLKLLENRTPQIIVAIDHQHQPLSAIMEWLGPGRKVWVKNSTLIIRPVPVTPDGAKDWARMLSEA